MDDCRKRLSAHRPIAALVIAAVCLAVVPGASGEQTPDTTVDQPPPAEDTKDKAPAEDTKAKAPAEDIKDKAPSEDTKDKAPAEDTRTKAPAPPLEPIPTDEAFSILGKEVRGPAGEDMGRVVDLLLDGDAQPRSVVIDFGGFLGVGSRRIAIDWRLLRFEPANLKAPLQLGLGKAEIQAAPEYKDTAKPPMMVGPPPERSDSDGGG
jgi:PRC-barrel domain